MQPQKADSSIRTLSTGRRIYSQAKRSAPVSVRNLPKTASFRSTAKQGEPNRHQSEAELAKALQEVEASCNELMSLERTPSEQEILNLLSRCEAVAKLLVYEPPSPSVDKKDSATSALLSLDESSSRKVPLQKQSQANRRMIDKLSNLAHSILKFPTVFITPKILELYVCVQSSLGKPDSLPDAFSLYASKPIPQEGSSPIRYAKQNPNKVANAIPAAAAERALQTAIDAKRLVAAMDIIEASYTTTAFHRAKFVRKGLLPATGLAVAPVAAYTVASQLAAFQTTMDAAMATNVAFAGIMAYVGFTATVGVVAVTTANDQMIRVTWAPGVPLRERWMREEERAAMDKVAVAWGFRDVWRRGEEEGEDWDAIREWIGRKSMMLDRVELMEGME